jgi:hypothetical protein
MDLLRRLGLRGAKGWDARRTSSTEEAPELGVEVGGGRLGVVVSKGAGAGGGSEDAVGGDGGSNIRSSAFFPKMSFDLTPSLASAPPRLSSTPSLTTHVPATATVPFSAAMSGPPSELDREEGGDSIPVPCGMRKSPDGCNRDPLPWPDTTLSGLPLVAFRDGRPLGAEYPRERSEPRLLAMDPLAVDAERVGGFEVDRRFSDGDSGGGEPDSTHSSPSSSVCQPGLDMIPMGTGLSCSC